MFSPDKWFTNPSTGFYPYTIGQSLRFNEDDAPRLTRDIGTPTNETVWTFSCWLKRSTLNSVEDADHPVVAGGTNASNYEVVGFWNTTDDVIINSTSTGSRNTNTTRVFRDLSSWYHLVVQRNGANQIIYINGEAVNTISSASSSDSYINKSGHTMTVGCHVPTLNTVCFDGYLADVVFVDGTAVPISSLGETLNGIWVAKDPSGLTFGNNGYYLKFADSSALGTDSAGGSAFATNGVAASDVVPDSPTNNFCTINILDSHAASTYTEGNLNFADNGGDGATCLSTFVVPDIADTTTYYIELLHHQGYALGIAPQEYSAAHNKVSRTGVLSWYSNGNLYNGSSVSTTSWSTASTTGEIRSMVVGNGQVEYFRNGVSLGVAFTGLTGAYKIAEWAAGSAGTGVTFNFGQDDTFANAVTSASAESADANGHGKFKYSEAASHLSLCAANIPEPAIGPNSGVGENSDDYFNTVLYNGDGAASNAITGVGHQPDFLWIKQRNATRGHQLMDSVRGASVRLQSHGGGLETASALVSFDSDGFTVDGTTLNGTNITSGTFVAWSWKAGGAASSIAVDAYSSGVPSIASSVSAAPDAGFSIVSWVGTENNSLIAHGLNQAPQLIIVKNRDDNANWPVYNEFIGAASRLYLDLENNAGGAATLWNSTAATNQVFSVGTANLSNGSTDEMIAYCFHSVDGFSKCGTFIGNGQNSPNGTFVHTGFLPAFVMVKGTTNSSSWVMVDDQRAAPYNIDTARLFANSSEDEAALNTNRYMELFSNGFRIHGDDSTSNANKWNENNDTHVFIAFAAAPQKYANAR